MSKRNLTFIDLFAGAGGMSLGFVGAGFEPVLAVESDRAAARTCEANLGPHVLAEPIEAVGDAAFPRASVVVGGPPCQGFSPLGRDRDDISRAALNNLWRQYRRVLEVVRPLVFVIENVPEFLASTQFQSLLRATRRSEQLRDYQIDYKILNAVEYGVPQRRRRGFVIGSRIGDPATMWPEATHGDGRIPHATVRDSIGDLPLRPTGTEITTLADGSQHLHFGRRPTAKSLERYRAVPPGGNRFDLAQRRPDLLPPCWKRKKSGTTDVFGRLSWDRPSLTIRTEFFKPEKGRYLHPQAHRPITYREAARLQTFPDTFVFEGKKLEVARQIGNAVPPVLAGALASRIADVLRHA